YGAVGHLRRAADDRGELVGGGFLVRLDDPGTAVNVGKTGEVDEFHIRSSHAQKGLLGINEVMRMLGVLKYFKGEVLLVVAGARRDRRRQRQPAPVVGVE